MSDDYYCPECDGYHGADELCATIKRLEAALKDALTLLGQASLPDPAKRRQVIADGWEALRR